ncbi:MAG TPA: hypothetical protein VF609_13270 [Flavisolibacter sp.]|jgi:hypothetical protein
MLQAKKTWYNDAGNKEVREIKIDSAEDAFNMAQHVFRVKETAYCVTMDRWMNGAFVTRVMSKEKMLFKIEHYVN